MINATPAKFLKEFMGMFLLNKNPQANIPALKENVHKLIDMVTQKSAGQNEKFQAKGHVSWAEYLDITMIAIIIEATMLVLSGKLDDLNEDG